MQRKLAHRAFSFCLAAVMTVAVLGSIDHLAKPVASDAPEAQMAKLVPMPATRA